jgi:hypothetical protein
MFRKWSTPVCGRSLPPKAFFVVTLRNTPVYDEETLRWLSQFRPHESAGQRRLSPTPSRQNPSTANTAIAEVDHDAAYREIRPWSKMAGSAAQTESRRFLSSSGV